MLEYINKNMGPEELEKELTNLIANYNQSMKKYLIIYAANPNLGDAPIYLDMDDYYNIRDLLRKNKSKKLSFYIETSGGSGEAAEEIAKFLRNKADYVDFIVAGECKSAGTILTMCGDKIYMNETGSLGPIDAQVQIGRTVGSAYDYDEWFKEKENQDSLNNLEAIMIAQIAPQELKLVHNTLAYGKELVKNFLSNYKFKNWKLTQSSQKKVSQEMRVERAEQIAEKLSNHSEWKTHGRSLKIDDLEKIGLKIDNIHDNPQIEEIIERIHVLLRLLIQSTSVYKLIMTNDNKLIKQAVELPQEGVTTHVDIGAKCPICFTEYLFYAKLIDDSSIDDTNQSEGKILLPEDAKFECSCGLILDLSQEKNDLENQIGKFIY
ncbi:MAG: ATP-dependent Clp protease proteolytic subunit [Methanobrevibacter sp.]|nr:ATP-dependent Clp protease proteolytic subunit [Methanobrevibacter sp.]